LDVVISVTESIKSILVNDKFEKKCEMGVPNYFAML